MPKTFITRNCIEWNKSEEFLMLKVTCKYSKTMRNCSFSYKSINKFQTWLVLLTSQTNLDSNQKIISQCLSSPHLSFRITSTSWSLLLWLLILSSFPALLTWCPWGYLHPLENVHPPPYALSATISIHKVPPSTIFHQSHKIVTGVKILQVPFIQCIGKTWIHIWLWVLPKIKPEENTLKKYPKNEDLSI